MDLSPESDGPALGLRERKGLDLIACPSCGRAQVDVIAVAKAAQAATVAAAAKEKAARLALGTVME